MYDKTVALIIASIINTFCRVPNWRHVNKINANIPESEWYKESLIGYPRPCHKDLYTFTFILNHGNRSRADQGVSWLNKEDIGLSPMTKVPTYYQKKKSIINELISIKTYSLTHKKNVPVHLTITSIEFVFSITSRNSPEVFFSNYVQWTFWCKNVSPSQGTIFCGIFCFIIKNCYSLSTSIH